jgi:hypothetical protein
MSRACNLAFDEFHLLQAHTARIKGILLIPAGAEPAVFLAGRPAAERAADAWAGRGVTLTLLKLLTRH